MKLEFYRLKKDDLFHKTLKSRHCIFFVLEGKGQCKTHVNKEYELVAKQMVFTPVSSDIAFKATEHTAVMLILFYNLSDTKSIQFINSLKKNLVEDSRCCQPYILEIKPFYDTFIDFLEKVYQSRWIKDPNILRYLLRGVFYLFGIAYTPEQNAHFFSPLLCSRYSFKNSVLTYHLDAKNVRELASLCNFPYHTFSRLFKEEFATTPYRWMIEERKKRIKETIETTDTPLKAIATQFHFNSIAHLSKFCREQMGQKASDIRKKAIKISRY